ncbi:hypothetical protein [Nonomuraea terrae]|uniref:hypothetical protein n=1 Tax=Nonomuraea terrae TaxID=2530383 RepID=UPI001404AE3D|nr:hypothetical protein [Nonomuraea terrae]
MSVRWEIGNKVQALQGWIGRRLGRATGNRRVAGKPDPEQPGRKVDDAPKH